MVEQDNSQQFQDEEKEFDLVEIAQKIWNGKKLIIKGCIIGAIVGLIVAFSIPKEYATSIKLSPEISDSKGKMTGGLNALASMAGVSINTGTVMDAVYPNLYPDIVNSVPFIVNLFEVKVTNSDGETMTLVDYLENDTRSPWWSAILSLPGKTIGWIVSLFKDEEGSSTKPNPFHLTKDQWMTVETLRKCIGADVDTKTSVITITSTMQDPMVSALLADTVAANLQTYITQYRTEKAIKDMDYAQKLNEEAKDEYYAAQQQYANYVDRNHNIALSSRRTEEERLRNEASLAFNLYNATSTNLQQARAKVQENTPVYAIIQPATVPLKATSSRLMKLIAFTFLGFVMTASWVVFADQAKEMLNKIISSNNTSSDK